MSYDIEVAHKALAETYAEVSAELAMLPGYSGGNMDRLMCIAKMLVLHSYAEKLFLASIEPGMSPTTEQISNGVSGLLLGLESFR